MDIDKINKWSDLLLDTGKRNNLINFHDTKMSTVEILAPSMSEIFSQIEHFHPLEVYDPKISDDLEEFDEEELAADSSSKRISKEQYLSVYKHKIRKNQLLIYNGNCKNPIQALNNIKKRAKTAIEETGVNIAYIAFGFINWTESDTSQHKINSPILLAPISIENDSAVEPYRIRILDDDIIVNPTFSFKLQNDYGRSLPPYEDEDIDSYLDTIKCFVSKLGWTISTECKIGIFSFLKINMYKDLKDNASNIVKNKNVRALLGERTYENSDSSNLSKPYANPLIQLHNIVDADSSQIEAIELSRSGKSFVLQGPPGTGKSQTITNIIAENLIDGKKVLFVSEKLAALNIVYDKLKNAGLDDFCLELHSHKANKKNVIQNLCSTLRKQPSIVSERAQKELEEKESAQKKLDSYAKELHKNRACVNKSLYQIYEEISACRDSEDIEYFIYSIKNKDEKYIKDVESSLSRFVEYTSTVGYDFRENPWFGYADIDYSYENIVELKSNLNDMLVFCEQLKDINDKINDEFVFSANNLNQIYILKDFFEVLKASDFLTPSLIDSQVFTKIYSIIKKLNILANQINEAKKILTENFDEEIYSFCGQNIYKKLTKQYTSPFSRIFNSDYKKLIKNIKLCQNKPKKLNYKTLVAIFTIFDDYEKKSDEFYNLEKEIKSQIGSAYKGVDTNFDILLEDFKKLEKVFASKIDFGVLPKLTTSHFYSLKNSFEDIYVSLEETINKFSYTKERLDSKFDKEAFDISNVAIAQLIKKLSICLDNIDKLPNWCEFSIFMSSIKNLEILDFIDCFIKKKASINKLVSTYKKIYYTQWTYEILKESPILTSFNRILHDETVNIFKQKDELNFDINKAKVKAYLSSQRPQLNMIAQGSAISILLREGEKKRKQKGIRSLLTEIGELAQTLKPCFLMSPLSVSTFLSSNVHFDVVIFDEASQIFPQDAIGSIYRGKQIIVVGDSRQMPPSNFFNSVVETDEENDVDDVADFESILDLCVATFPQKRLKWHYRSKFEDLITFSNKNFYENDLITFPSSMNKTQGIGVDYFYVNGIFDRKSKTNRIEAEKIVELVFDNIKRFPNRSLGVVAFSISQQTLIENLIAKRRKQNPENEEFFSSKKVEPFFVKNLETVQGDERDTIIFSIAYAKDIQGRLLLNFGPINRAGGERRLNVAITRAKYNVQLVTSMHCSDIDLSRTNSTGAKLLREYLDFAENGNMALERAIDVNSFEDFDSEFELEVCEYLKEKGFSVDTQVGCSSFKIDLAVKHPNSSNYILAIECDGATYHSSKNARDRDRLRQTILESMGWKFYRIWSTDWFKNNSVEKERLLNAINKAVENTNVKTEELPSITEFSPAFEETVEIKSFEFPTYDMIDDRLVARTCGYDGLKTFLLIINRESPISKEWLLKRAAPLFGREKITSVIRDNLDYYLNQCFKVGVTEKNGFLFAKDKEVPLLRVPEKYSSTIREIKHISLEELSLGLKEVIKQNISVEKNGLFRIVAQQLGFNRTTESMIDRFESALKLINDEVEIHDGKITLNQH